MTAQLDCTEAPKAVLANLDDQAQAAVSKLLQIQQETPEQIAPVIEALRVLRIIPGAERHSIAATVPFVTRDTLRKHTLKLQRNVDLRLLMPYLLSDELLTLDEQYALTNQSVPYSERIENLVLWVSQKGPNGPSRLLQCLRRSVIENPGAAAGHAFVDELLSKASCLTEQTVNADGQIRRYQQVDAKKSVKFAKLVREAWRKLKNTIDPEELKLFIRPLDESLASDDCKELIENAKNTEEVLGVLSNSRSSNYRDTSLFTIIVEEFCAPDDELVKKLQQYNQELEEERLSIATNLTVTGNTESEFQEQTLKTGSPPPPAKKQCLKT